MGKLEQQLKSIDDEHHKKDRRIFRSSLAGLIVGCAGMFYASTGVSGTNTLPPFTGNQYAKSAEVKVYKELDRATFNLEIARQNLVERVYGINWEGTGESSDRYFEAVKTLKEAKDSIAEERDKLTLTENFKAYENEVINNAKYGFGMIFGGFLVSIASLFIGKNRGKRNDKNYFAKRDDLIDSSIGRK